MHRRITYLYSLLSVLMAIIFYRLYYISQNKNFAMVSEKQSSYILDINNQRGFIYDRNFKPLVNEDDEFVASVIPTPETITKISNHITPEQKNQIISKIRENKPFLIKVNNYDIYFDGIEIINIKQRYSKNQLAPHIIGYINSSGDGVCGIEKSYDEFLKSHINKIKIKYKTNALGNSFDLALPSIDYGDKENKHGIVLTLDKDIQEISENAAKTLDKGAIIVMDPQNGDLLSVVSTPKFDSNNVADFLKDNRCPMINRALCSYNVGSTYKLLVACAALEEDFNKFIKFSSHCVGYQQIDPNVFRCHFLPGHGTINMTKALEISCNPYFINLALETGPMNILKLSKKLGFGSSDILAPNIIANKGVLPDKSNLSTKSDVANLGFGQGQLMITPIQIAKMISMIANDGYAVVPKLVKGFSDKSGLILEKQESSSTQAKIISTKTARTVKDMMICVVEDGSGKNAKPSIGGAGGKTASAQTGQYLTTSQYPQPNQSSANNQSKEIVHAWFAGFFPAQKPRYVVVVLAEGGESGSDIAAPVFKKIADQINNLK